MKTGFVAALVAAAAMGAPWAAMAACGGQAAGPLAIIATLVVPPGGGDALERLFDGMAADVRANEPDVLAYRLAKSRTAAETYRIIEIYRNQAAFDNHIARPAVRASLGQMRALLAAPPQGERHDLCGAP